MINTDSQSCLLSEIAQLFAGAVSNNRRCLLSINWPSEQSLSPVDLEWIIKQHESVSPLTIKSSVIWIGDDLPEWAEQYQESMGVPLQHCHQARAKDLLGTSNQLIIYDAREAFSPNVFAASIDSVLGTGVYLLLQYRRDTESSSLYQRYLLDQFSCFKQSFPGHLTQIDLSTFRSAIDQAEDHLPVSINKSQQNKQLKNTPTVQQAPLIADANKQQCAFVERSLVSLDQQLHSSCIMLEAKRGRGKSAALAWLIQSWLNQDPKRTVWLCAPSRKQVQTQMAIWSSSSPELIGRVKYHAIDELLDRLERDDTDEAAVANTNILVVIDEAAAISLALLKKLAVKRFNLILATTTVGYEGSGRGFLLRFKNYLKEIYASYDEYTIKEPIRWSQSDRLEKLVEDICGLGWREDAVAKEDFKDLALGSLSINKVNRESLFTNSELLKSIYGLLVDAHYQTQPSDLQRLLDDGGMYLWVALTEQNKVVGVLQATEEGGFGERGQEQLAQEVAMGFRRPPGNLVAQRLAYHYNNADWCLVRSLRVMRIAVDSGCQRRGVGSRLINAMTRWAKSNNFELWTSSFGYSDELLRFWRLQGAQLVYLGSRVDKASGNVNAMIVGAIADKGLTTVQSQFKKEQAVRQLVLKRDFDGLASVDIGRMGQAEQSRLKRFINGGWDWDSAFALIVMRLLELKQSGKNLNPAPDQLLNDLLRFAPDWKALATHNSLPGKAKYFDFIRTYLAQSHNIATS